MPSFMEVDEQGKALVHYGVKGMKWGEYKDPENDPNYRPKNRTGFVTQNRVSINSPKGPDLSKHLKITNTKGRVQTGGSGVSSRNASESMPVSGVAVRRAKPKRQMTEDEIDESLGITKEKKEQWRKEAEEADKRFKDENDPYYEGSPDTIYEENLEIERNVAWNEKFEKDFQSSPEARAITRQVAMEVRQGKISPENQQAELEKRMQKAIKRKKREYIGKEKVDELMKEIQSKDWAKGESAESLEETLDMWVASEGSKKYYSDRLTGYVSQLAKTL